MAEHLAADYAEQLIASLVELSDVVLFSAAIPGQGGAHHVNEQWPGYWAARFGKHGYVPVDCLRRQLWANPDVDYWYAQNALIYVRRTRLEDYPALAREHELMGGSAHALVHPRKYQEVIDWAMSLHEAG